MFDRILVPLDGTDVATNALVAGDHLAKKWGCQLEVLYLTRTFDESLGIDHIVREQAGKMVDAEHVVIQPLQYSVADDIAQHFDKVPNTLVVMNTEARGRIAAVLDNVAEEVLRTIRQPLLLLGNGVELDEDWPTGPIMVCTDGSDFAESIGPLAATWARELGQPLMLVTVIDTSAVPPDISPVSEINAVANFARDLETSGATGSGSATALAVNYDALHGDNPSKAIVDYADAIDASMIVMATHGRSGLRRAVYGSVAMDVIRHADCPVLVRRP
ncbi:MAG: universal stress protein [Acidimicrobiia bacterium]|nr:universal stress protein [Acidimicrobiia bacterium]